MAVYFFDSSALVKRYALETGSEWVMATTEPQTGHTLYIVTGLVDMLRLLDDLGVRATLFAMAENLDDPDKRELFLPGTPDPGFRRKRCRRRY